MRQFTSHHGKLFLWWIFQSLPSVWLHYRDRLTGKNIWEIRGWPWNAKQHSKVCLLGQLLMEGGHARFRRKHKEPGECVVTWSYPISCVAVDCFARRIPRRDKRSPTVSSISCALSHQGRYVPTLEIWADITGPKVPAFQTWLHIFNDLCADFFL